MSGPRKWYDPFYRETVGGRYIVYPLGVGTRGYEIRDPERMERIRGFNRTAFKVLFAGTIAVWTLPLIFGELEVMPPVALAALLYALFVIPAGVVYVVGLRRLLAGTPRTEKLHYSEFVRMQANIFGTKVLYLTVAVDVALLIFLVAVFVYGPAEVLGTSSPLIAAVTGIFSIFVVGSLIMTVRMIQLKRRDPSAEHDEPAPGTGRE